MTIGLADPSVVINNVAVRIVPNSLVITDGFGERNVRTQSGGNGDIDHVVTENAETKFSNFNFMLFPTEDNLALLRTWLNNLDQNGCSAVFAGQSRNVTGAVIVNNPELSFGNDTTIPIEFQGKAAV